MMQRSAKITGPYTERRQLSQAQPQFHEPNQGGLVQAPSCGRLVLLLPITGAGSWEGRPASLLPVSTWVDGWPVLGNVGPDSHRHDGVERTQTRSKRPVCLFRRSDDDFQRPRSCGVQWEWNYQPRGGKWSLSERSGWLRLHA